MSITRHNPKEVLLGTVGASDAEVTTEESEVSVNPAGKIVILGDSLLGVSLGGSPLKKDHIAVCRVGLRVPALLTDEGAKATGTIEIDDYESIVSESVVIGGFEFVAKATASTLGLAEFTASDSNEDTAQSLCDAINAYDGINKLVLANVTGAVVTITATLTGEDSNEIEFSYEGSTGVTISGSGTLEGGLNSYDYVIRGTQVKVDLATGKLASTGQATGAVYFENGSLKGIKPMFTGYEDVAIIDMPGGL